MYHLRFLNQLVGRMDSHRGADCGPLVAGWTPLVRRTLHADLNRDAFHYEANEDYTLNLSVVIGKWINYAYTDGQIF